MTSHRFGLQERNVVRRWEEKADRRPRGAVYMQATARCDGFHDSHSHNSLALPSPNEIFPTNEPTIVTCVEFNARLVGNLVESTEDPELEFSTPITILTYYSDLQLSVDFEVNLSFLFCETRDSNPKDQIRILDLKGKKSIAWIASATPVVYVGVS